MDPKKYPLEYYKSPGEPYLKYEMKHDNMTARISRDMRRSPLAQDRGNADKRQIYIFEQRDINNTYIKRGFHITVRDFDTLEVLNDEYGDIGPLDDGRRTPGKILWYKPHDYMHPNYTFAEELLPTFVMPRPEGFKLDYFDDKRADVWFQRIKKSNFLPRCLREQVVT